MTQLVSYTMWDTHLWARTNLPHCWFHSVCTDSLLLLCLVIGQTPTEPFNEKPILMFYCLMAIASPPTTNEPHSHARTNERSLQLVLRSSLLPFYIFLFFTYGVSHLPDCLNDRGGLIRAYFIRLEIGKMVVLLEQALATGKPPGPARTRSRWSVCYVFKRMAVLAVTAAIGMNSRRKRHSSSERGECRPE